MKTFKEYINESYDKNSLNEKMDTEYWAAYNYDEWAPDSWADKSKDFEDTFEEAIVNWQQEAERSSMLKNKDIQYVRKLAEEFFKIEKWISINVIHAMITQSF